MSISTSNVKEEEGRPLSMASPTTQETETTQMNNSDENEQGVQLPTAEPADLQPEDKKKIEAVRDRMLEALLKAVEEKQDEIFAVKDTKKKKLPDTTPVSPEPKSKPITRTGGIIIIKIQEPISWKAGPSNIVVPLTFRKRKRKQERPSRAPMGDGLDEIIEAKTWAKPGPLRASSPVEDKRKRKKKKETQNCNFPEFAWSWGRKEAEKDFNDLLGQKPRRRSTRRPRDEFTSVHS